MTFKPNRDPFFIAWCHNGNPVPPWVTEPGFFARIEREAASYARLVFHMLPAQQGIGGDYGANLASVLTPVALADLCGLIARRAAKGQLTGVYVGRKIQAEGTTPTVDAAGAALPLKELQADDIATLRWFVREIVPVLEGSGVPRLEVFVDAFGREGLLALAEVYKGFGVTFGGEGWTWSVDAYGRTTLDKLAARRAAYWSTLGFFELHDGSATQDDLGNRVSAGKGGKLGSVSAALTELHLCFNIGWFMKWERQGDGRRWAGFTSTPAEVAALIKGWRSRGFIVSGTVDWTDAPEWKVVQDAILMPGSAAPT